MNAQDVIVGLAALGVGALFCFRGAIAMRLVIAMWGAFIGFMAGAGAVAGTDGSGFLRTTIGWIVGMVLAMVFSAVAYLFYEVAVVLAMASIGFALGTTVMAAFGVSWSWVVIAVGVSAGVLLALVTLASNMPLVILVVLSAFGGASAMVTGAMLIVGTVDSEDFTHATATDQLHASWWWYALYLGLALAGMATQFRFLESIRASMRDQWQPASHHG